MKEHYSRDAAIGKTSKTMVLPLKNHLLQKAFYISLLKSDNIQYNMVGPSDNGTIVPLSDGPMFILIDWE